MAVERPAFGFEILELSGACVAGPDQDEHSARRLPGRVQKRLDRIAAEVRIDGQGVRVPDQVPFAPYQEAAEGRIGIGGRGGGDVVALRIEDRQQPAVPGAAQQTLLDGKALRSADLEKLRSAA